MDSINCAIFNADLAKALGKRENESDLEIFHRSHNNRIITFLLPKLYPEKINALFQALHLSQYVFLYVDKIDSTLGETLIAIDALEKQNGFVALDDSIDEALFSKVVKGNPAESYLRISKDEILDKLAAADLKRVEGKTIVDMDAMFNVKNIGLIGLGFVSQGNLLKFQAMKALPCNRDITIRTIQKQDKDFNDAQCNDRVGVSLKGIEVDDFSRGLVLTDDPEFFALKDLKLEFEKNKFYKKELSLNQQLHLQCRMQITGCLVKQLSPLVVEASKPIACKKGSQIALIDIDSKPRIAGKGKVI